MPRALMRGDNEQRVSNRAVGGCGAAGSNVPLSYGELQRGLRDVLSHVELRCDGDAEERKLFLLNEFTRLMNAASEETRQMLIPTQNDLPLSFRVLEVLHSRRRVLCRGFELTLNELKEWLSLATLIGEQDVAQFLGQYARELGPASRQSVEDAIYIHQSNVAALCGAVLEIPTLTGTFSPFNSHYYTIVLDDLISMADEAPQATLLQSVQREVTLEMREMHVEWLLQVTLASNLQLETFFLAVSIFDRYLSKVSVPRERLHLVVCASLLLASKQEEIFPVPLRTLVRYGGDRFSLEMLVAMECQLFATLGFNVVCPTFSAVGLGLLLQQDPPASEQQRFFLLYTLATLAIRTHFRQCRLSSLAAAAVYLGRAVFNIPSGMPSDEVRALLPLVMAALCRNPAVGAGGVYDIFGRSAFCEVSKLKLPEIL
ncbi:mitotic cyclin [Trypanosoma grayi]|uniref:mitotic cyclin n=1 Tax=Trypanosoma grayi TaxID=71804 RepID=UPI0004F46A5F|nr:mitotic cyclin [Trypanosoma grayi]KEG12270.1 mitotic cyclin [Trypanosoma grayi]